MKITFKRDDWKYRPSIDRRAARKTWLWVFGFCLALVITQAEAQVSNASTPMPPSRAAGSGEELALVKELIVEFRNLRVEMIEHLMDAQNSTISMFQRDLDQVRQEHKRLQRQEIQQREQVTQLDEQLSNPELEAESRPQLAALRDELVSASAANVRAELLKVQERERELNECLQREVHRRQKLREKFQQLNRHLSQRVF